MHVQTQPMGTVSHSSCTEAQVQVWEAHVCLSKDLQSPEVDGYHQTPVCFCSSAQEFLPKSLWPATPTGLMAKMAGMVLLVGTLAESSFHHSSFQCWSTHGEVDSSEWQHVSWVKMVCFTVQTDCTSCHLPKDVHSWQLLREIIIKTSTNKNPLITYQLWVSCCHMLTFQWGRFVWQLLSLSDCGLWSGGPQARLESDTIFLGPAILPHTLIWNKQSLSALHLTLTRVFLISSPLFPS